MITRCACVCAVAWLITAPCAADAEPLGIRLACDGTTLGSGVLVEDFRPGTSGDLLLLTALHVLHGCSRVEVQQVGCKYSDTQLLATWDAEHPIELVAWTRYDLAAIVIPAADRARFLERLRAIDLWRPVEDEPALLDRMTVVAKADLNVCPRIPAEMREQHPVLELFRESGDPDYYKQFGSLAGDVNVLLYQATVVPGTSGGPVVWKQTGRDAVVAVHLGGHTLVMGMGLILEKDVLRRSLESGNGVQTLRLDAEHPSIRTSKFAPPLRLTTTDANATADLELAMNRNSLSLSFESSTPVDPLGAVSNSLQVGWTHQWVRLPWALDTSFATRVSIGGMSGLYRSPVFEPQPNGRREEPLEGTAKLPFIGGFVEADVEAHFARFAPVGWVLGAGMRVGGSYLPDVERSPSHWVWGPVWYGRVKWRWTDSLSGIGQLHLTVERIPADMTPIDCAEPSVPGPEVWDVWGGLGAGVELRL